MANKAFEIQNSTLRIGGVDLQAGSNSIVIPGVTQATNYRVEEVDDLNKNVVREDFDITQKQFEKLKSQKGIVIWLTGFSGSGKSIAFFSSFSVYR